MALTDILVVADVERDRRWYAEVLGASLYREYGGTSAVFSWGAEFFTPRGFTLDRSTRRPVTVRTVEGDQDR